MRLKILGSSSQGNCYILENEQEALMIECGVKMQEIKAGLDFNLSKVVGCLLSHEHGDHSKSFMYMLAAGIKVFGTMGTGEALKITDSMNVSDHHNFHPIKTGQKIQIGGFKVLAFETKHDAAEPCCFLIYHEDCGNVLFLTDTYYVEYTFRNLNQVIIEANYCQQIIDEKMRNDAGQQFLRDRILQSHMSLATCKDTLKANDLSAVQNIVLIHLSNSNSDATRFRAEVAAATGKLVHVADKGMIIEDFTKQPF